MFRILRGFTPKLSVSRRVNRLIAKGDEANRQREWVSAAAYYEGALLLAPSLAPIYVQLGHALKEQGFLDRAEQAYRSAIGIQPSVSDSHLQLGHVLKLQHRRDEGIAAYAEACRIDPTSHESARELDELKLLALPSRSKNDIAVETEIKAYLTLGDRARDRQDWVGASYAYQEYVNRTPFDFAIWVQLGHALKEAERFNDALEAYREAYRIHPDDSDLLLNLGRFAERCGDCATAAYFYRRSALVDGNQDAAWQLEADTLRPHQEETERKIADAADPFSTGCFVSAVAAASQNVVTKTCLAKDRSEQISSVLHAAAQRDLQMIELTRAYAERESSRARAVELDIEIANRLGQMRDMYRQSPFASVVPEPIRVPPQLPSPSKWGVMATPHTLFIARLLASRLRHHGWTAEILTEAPAGFPHDMYVVACAQMFQELPPGEKRIVFQLEQSVSSRWFTEEYLDVLENSLAVLEYSITNMEFLEKNRVRFPQVHYIPIGTVPDYMSDFPSDGKKYDVLFYGDANSSPRRRELLTVLQAHFEVRVCGDLFGLEIVNAIREARLIVNLHYYDNALLEMPRIGECLSLGVPIVSESTDDQDEYPELTGAVTFFAQNNAFEMVNAVRAALSNPPPPLRSLQQHAFAANVLNSCLTAF